MIMKRKIIYKLKICEQANKEHAKSKRQYAHVFHKKNTICIADAFYDLPTKHRIGIQLHEIGHLLSPDSGEFGADLAIKKYYNIEIKYKDSQYGKRLQYVQLT